MTTISKLTEVLAVAYHAKKMMMRVNLKSSINDYLRALAKAQRHRV